MTNSYNHHQTYTTAEQLNHREFLTQFENQTLNPIHFNHVGHLRLAWIYLNHHDLETSIQGVCTGIKAFAESLQANTKFHVTITEFNLPRSTLLYYDKIGLLKPSERTESEYRLYSEQDFSRMSKIALYKKAGLSLDAIARILDSISNILEQRLESLNSEMSRIRQQQRFILQLLGENSLLKNIRVMNKEQWVKILEDSGMDHETMHQWHVEFERSLPEAHHDFLEALGMSKKEIEAIRTSAQKAITHL